MEVVVAKFGGSVLRSGRDYRRAAEIVSRELEERRVVVVVSAMKGVTDMLLGAVASPSWASDAAKIERMHISALDKAVEGREARERAYPRLLELFSELRKALWAAHVLGEDSPRVRDYIASFGERMSAVIMAAALRDLGLEAFDVAGWEAGIVTDDSFGEAVPLPESEEKVRKILGKKLLEGVPVVTGFIAATRDGRITTLGRGGSDYTATLIASYLGAREARLYTDVPGIMTCDPRVAPSARTIPVLSVEEALELAYLGAKRMHPRTFEPLLERPVRVRVLSAEDPEGPSTLVTREGGGPPLKAVALYPGLAAVTVKGAGMVGRPGTAAAVMGSFYEAGVNIVAIMQPVSEVAITVVVREEDAEKAAAVLRRRFPGTGIVRTIEVRRGLTAVSVVGEGLRDPEVVAEVLSRVGGEKVLGVTRGLGELSITLLVESRRASQLARRLHDEVVLRARQD